MENELFSFEVKEPVGDLKAGYWKCTLKHPYTNFFGSATFDYIIVDYNKGTIKLIKDCLSPTTYIERHMRLIIK